MYDVLAFGFVFKACRPTFLSLAHEVGVEDIAITMSGRSAVRPCFVSGRYLENS